MSKALNKAIERMQPGAVLRVVDHTNRPELVGSSRTVVGTIRGSKRLFNCRSDHDGAGRDHAMELPASNLQWLDDDTIRFPIGNGRLAGHTVTLSFVR